MIVVNKVPIFICRVCNGFGRINTGRADAWGQVMVGCCLEPCHHCGGTGKKQPKIALLPKDKTKLDKALEDFFNAQ